MKITVIGGGNMGITYAQSIHANFSNSIISIVEKDAEKIEHLKKTTPFKVFNNAEDCIVDAEIIFLAIKPQVCQDVFKTIKDLVNPEQIIISIMAGVTLDSMSNGIGVPKIVRAMPNLPAQVGKGVTGYLNSSKISNSEAAIIKDLLSSTGTVIKLTNEQDIDAITALSGSGPAYVFYFMNAMIEQAQTFGFDENEAKSIILNTFKGTIDLFENSNDSANTWIDRVTSKGGTTHQALTTFTNLNTEDNIKQGVKAAFERAKELGKS